MALSWRLLVPTKFVPRTTFSLGKKKVSSFMRSSTRGENWQGATLNDQISQLFNRTEKLKDVLHFLSSTQIVDRLDKTSEVCLALLPSDSRFLFFYFCEEKGGSVDCRLGIHFWAATTWRYRYWRFRYSLRWLCYFCSKRKNRIPITVTLVCFMSVIQGLAAGP